MNRAARRKMDKGIIGNGNVVAMTKGTVKQVIKQEANATIQKAREEGMTMMMTIMLMNLKDEFGFSSNKNGNGRLDKMIDATSKSLGELQDAESVTSFCYEYYLKKMTEKLKAKTGITIEMED